MKFSIDDFFSKFDQTLRKPRIWSHLLKKSLMENFIFCAVRAFPDDEYRHTFQLKLEDFVNIVTMVPFGLSVDFI